MEMLVTMKSCGQQRVLLLLLLLLFTAIGFSPGGSSPYTSTHNTNGNIIYMGILLQGNSFCEEIIEVFE
jgi:hypothetical protein